MKLNGDTNGDETLLTTLLTNTSTISQVDPFQPRFPILDSGKFWGRQAPRHFLIYINGILMGIRSYLWLIYGIK